MRALTLVLLLMACATAKPVKHAQTFRKHGYVFEGPKAVTVVATGLDTRRFEQLLTDNGFQVFRPIPGVKTELRTRYVVNVSGTCGSTRVLGSVDGHTVTVDEGELKVEAYDSVTTERVFAAHPEEDGDCPDGFFGDVSAALSRDWAQTGKSEKRVEPPSET